MTIGLLLTAVVDCEALHGVWPQQPTNTWSSLAFVAVGGVVISRGRALEARFAGVAAVLVGAGSILFHGTEGSFAGWLHDWSIVVLLAVLAVSRIPARRRVPMVVIAAVLSGIVIGYVPPAGEWLAILSAAVVVGVEAVSLRDRRLRPMSLAAGFLGGGAILTVLGRTGGPLCSADSVLQAHAGWHVLAALAVLAYATARGWLATRSGGGGSVPS